MIKSCGMQDPAITISRQSNHHGVCVLTEIKLIYNIILVSGRYSVMLGCIITQDHL